MFKKIGLELVVDNIRDFLSSVTAANTSTSKLGQTAIDAGKALDVLDKALVETAEEANKVGQTTVNAGKALDVFDKALVETANDAKKVADEQNKVNKVVEETDATKIDNLRKSVKELGEETSNTEKAATFFAQAWSGAAEAVGGFVVDKVMEAAGKVKDFITSAPQMAMDFQDKMQLFASVSSGPDAANAQIKDLIMQLGKELPISTMEAADAAVELARGGLSPATLQAGALRDTVNFAQGAMIGLEEASTIVVKQLGTFVKVGSTAEEQSAFMAQSMDLMVKAANASTLQVSELSLGLQEAGGTAKAIGLDYESFVTTMGVLSPAFSSASTAGTSFKNFLLRLKPTSKTAYDEMAKLNLVSLDTGKAMAWLATQGVKPLSEDVNTLTGQVVEYMKTDLGASKKDIDDMLESLSSNAFYDANGNLKSMAEVSQILQDVTKNLSNEERSFAMSKIFGNEAMNAAVQLADQGAKGYTTFSNAMKQANGVAEQAGVVNQGANFQMNQYQGTLEALKLTLGDKTIPYMEDFYAVLNDVTMTALTLTEAIFGNQESLAKLPNSLSGVIVFTKNLTAAWNILNGMLVHARDRTVDYSYALKTVPEYMANAMVFITDLSFAYKELTAEGGQLTIIYAQVASAFSQVYAYILTLGPAVAPLIMTFEQLYITAAEIAQRLAPVFAQLSTIFGSSGADAVSWGEVIRSTLYLVSTVVSVVLLGTFHLFKNYIDAILNVWNFFGDDIVFTITNVLRTIQYLYVLISTLTAGLLDTIIALFTGNFDKIPGIATENFKRLSEATQNYFSDYGARLVSYVVNLWGKVKKAFFDNWNWKAVVEQMLEGFLMAFAGGTGGIILAIAKFGGSLLKALRKALDMKSPSRKMMEIGQLASKGFLLGFASNSDAVKRLVEDMAYNTVISPAANAANSQTVNNATTNNNYNLGVTTSVQASNVIYSFALMQAMT